MEALKKASSGAKPEEVKLPEYLKGRFASLSKEREDVWREIYSTAHLIALFCRGKQQVRRARYSAGWRPYGDLKDTATDDIRSINLTRFYMDNIVVKWVQSSADLVVKAARDTDQATMAARAGDIVIEHYENALYSAAFKQREARLALITGTYVRRFYYVSDGTTKARRPVFEPITLQGSQSLYCTDCGAMEQGEAAGAEACPSCGSQAIIKDQAPPTEVQSLTKMEEYASGRICCDSVPLWNLRYDLSESPEESPYLIYSRRVRRDVVLGQLAGKMKVDAGKSQDPGLDAVSALAYAGPAVGGKNLTGAGLINRADEEDAQFVDLVEMWLEPEMYGHIVLKQPVQTITGQTIPAGPLIDSFPKGLCVMGMDQMGTILYLFDECKKDHWVSQQYYLDVVTGAGDGLVDIIEIQRQFNIGNSQIFTQIRAQATPAVLFDKDLISGDKAAYLGNPKQNIPVDLTRLPEQRTLQQAVHQLPPGSLPGHVIEYVHQFLNNMFQLTAHTTDFSGGLPGVDNKTATGAKVGQSLAQSLHAPQLQLLAEMNQRSAIIVLKLFKEYCKDEHYLKLSGKSGADEGIWLKASQIETDVTIEVVPESWLPQNSFERQERLKSFIQFFGNVEGLQSAMQVSPHLVGELAKLCDVELDMGSDWDAAMRLGRSRIEKLKQGLPMVETMATNMPPGVIQGITDMGGDPAVLFANMLLNQLDPKPDIREDGHASAAAYYCSWLTTDEGLKATPILREAIKALADQHLRFQLQGGPMATAQMPMMGMGMPPMGGAPAGGGGAPQMSPEQGQPEQSAQLQAPQPGAMGG
jgi:hypothetical protein